jgi:thiol:disulfide interchange protein DsbD
MQLIKNLSFRGSGDSYSLALPRLGFWLSPLLTLFLLLTTAHAEDSDVFSELADMPSAPGSRHVSSRLLVDRNAVEPEMPASDKGVRVGVLFDIEKHWHIYWKNSGEAAIPTKVKLSAPEGWEISELQWPIPNRYIERGDITTYGYSNEVLLYAYLKPPDEILEAPTSVEIEAEASYLVCKDICVPGRDKQVLKIPYAKDIAISPSENFTSFEHYSELIPKDTSRHVDGLNLKSTLSHNAIAPGESGNLFLTLEHQESVKVSEKTLQIFPHQSDGVTFETPKLLRSGETESLLALPFVLDKDVPKESISLSGILVIDAESISKEKPLGLPWNASLVVASTSSLNTSVSNAPLSAGKPLSYRSSHYADTASGAKHSNTKQLVYQDDISIAYALVCAFLGGMILNLMPCVLPIISIKVMGFIGGADQPRAHSLRAALSFSLGVVSSFLLLAALVVALRSSGTSAGWGFQFQHPEFVYSLTLIVFVLGLGFFDVYSINLPGMQSANKGVSSIRSPLLKHFFDGVLATALSTPCTAPFLGTALVFAFSQAAWITFLIFFVMGLGLALPYAYLSTHPKMLSLLPAPGPWMYRFRQLMGFLLMGTVLWLLFVLQQLTTKGAIWTISTMLLIFFGLWLLSWISEARRSKGRFFAQCIAILSISLAMIYLYPSATGQVVEVSKIDWQPYSAELLEELQEQEKVVFIDFTADWCITCKANEFLTIETEEVISAMKRLEVVPVKADWTRGDQHITDALESYGAEGVPLYVVIPASAKSKARILSALPTKSGLIAALEDAKKHL